ncbi:hypothetical protein F5Y15DRAFT_136456 [Xylariaceae sp. FL0016]|nr:hypothetical protein F5Y15DRAFT_136456 [Xylariaceae sp. FL0016]
MEPVSLPQDILLLLCQELATRRDFATLYQCALVGRRMASISVEQLYRIRDVADAFPDDKLDTACLWRSIVLSSIGATAYPYAAYVRALSLGQLEECLEDMRGDKDLRDYFFQGPMQPFQVLRDGFQVPKKQLRNTPRLPPLDVSKTLCKCADSITTYIREVADDNGTAVALAHLEGYYIPHDILPKWITRLGTLTSLRLRDGSVLGLEAARAIVECCPNFCDLTCYYYQSGSADEDMAAFFQTLRPNSLQKFEVLSRNQIAEHTLTALNAHAESLKALVLRSLAPLAMKNLNLLSQCISLETLLIENDGHDKVWLKDFSAGLLKEIAKWISNCKQLRDLTFTHVLDALTILKDVLNCTDIHLTSLRVKDFQEISDDVTQATWRALGQQEHLQHLTLAELDGVPDGLVLARHRQLIDSICALENLDDLNLIEASVASPEIRRFSRYLPNLTSLSFGGDLVDDSILDAFSAFPKLNSVSINATSVFRFESLQTFAQSLDPIKHAGISFDILNQWYETRLTDDEEHWLKQYFVNTLDGSISITYPSGPDEMHEGDFSESD